MTTLHYTSGNNLDGQGNFVPGQVGFNLADVTSVAQLNALPDGVKGLVWLDEGNGVTQEFIDKVTPFIGNPKLYGFFLKDEPDVTGNWGPLVTAADLKAESDWIHANVPGAKTFITMMNLGSSANPSYVDALTPENTNIDLFGISAYPVRTETSTVDYDLIDRHVAAAQEAGISVDQMVPIYQTFGGGEWVTDGGGRYVMPTVEQQQEMLQRWEALVPNPAFDYAYAWGSQRGSVTLESSEALQDLFLQHNLDDGDSDTGGGTPVIDPPDAEVPVDPPDAEAPPIDPPDAELPVDPPATELPPVVDAGGRCDDDANGNTPAPPSIDPTPVNFPGWHGGHGGHGHGRGDGLDFSQFPGFGRPDWAGSPQSGGGRGHWSDAVHNGGGEHSWFGSGPGSAWHGLKGLTQLASDDASSAEASDGGARFSHLHSALATAAQSHFAEALPDGFGRPGDHWHW